MQLGMGSLMLCGALSKVVGIALPYGGECFRSFALSPTPAFARFPLAAQQAILSAAELLRLAEACLNTRGGSKKKTKVMDSLAGAKHR